MNRLSSSNPPGRARNFELLLCVGQSHEREPEGGEAATGDLRHARGWLGRVGVKTLIIVPGSPWENGYVESFNGRRRDELLKGQLSGAPVAAAGLT